MKNEWAIKAIPEHFSDLDYIFESVIMAGLIFFMEEDNGMEELEHNSVPWDVDTDDWDPQRKVVYDTMMAAYEFFKNIETHRPVAPHLTPTYESCEDSNLSKVIFSDTDKELVREHVKKSKEFNHTKNEHLGNVFKYRRYLWS